MAPSLVGWRCRMRPSRTAACGPFAALTRWASCPIPSSLTNRDRCSGVVSRWLTSMNQEQSPWHWRLARCPSTIREYSIAPPRIAPMRPGLVLCSSLLLLKLRRTVASARQLLFLANARRHTGRSHHGGPPKVSVQGPPKTQVPLPPMLRHWLYTAVSSERPCSKHQNIIKVKLDP